MCVCVDFSDSEDGDEQGDCFITFTTSESRCDNLFDQGVDMVGQGDPRAALNTFLDTLTSLQECQYTNKLLPTLHQLAEAYRTLGEMEKAREISDTVCLMQEAMNDTLKEKWKTRKQSRRAKPVLEQTDYGSLFLQKANSCETLAQDLEQNGDIEQALEHSKSAFRIRQYVLGPHSPSTEESLRHLIALYMKEGSMVHIVPDSAEKIMFTSETQSPCTGMSPPLCANILECADNGTSQESSSVHPVSISEDNNFCTTCTTTCTTTSCTTTSMTSGIQEVSTESAGPDKILGDKFLECKGTQLNYSLTSLGEGTNRSSIYSLLVVFGITAIAAVSFYFM